MTTCELNPENVHSILINCLYRDEEILGNAPELKDAVIVHGIINDFRFHSGRLEKHRDEIKTMLLELPEAFHADKGGGWSFLNACTDKNGYQWGEHQNMEELFCLGIGLNMVRYCLPRNLWNVLPGGMPYIQINVEGFSQKMSVKYKREEGRNAEQKARSEWHERP